tara:strand:+ start:23882 stop:25834 length:1953 start_codon:yes stop_codon:yes gene_type:complete
MNNNLSYSIIKDNNFVNIENTITKVLPRKTDIWIEDISVKNCFSCNIEFTILKRKHHCRGCGKIFCYYCSNNYIAGELNHLNIIDRDIFLNNLISIKKFNSHKVCNNCYILFNRITKLSNTILLFELLPFNIQEIYQFRLVCKTWNESILIYLSKFREIQYFTPFNKFNKISYKLLLNNFDIIKGHNKYIIHFINYYNWNKLSKNKILKILNEIIKKSEYKCKFIMCCRLCTHQHKDKLFDDTDIIYILKYNKNIHIREFILKYITTNIDKLINLIPLLVYCLQFEQVTNYPLGLFLLNKAKKNDQFAFYLYVELNNTNYKLKIYNHILNKLKYYIANNKSKIIYTYDYLKKIKANILTYSEINNIYYPFQIDTKINYVYDKDIIKKTSYNNPIIIPFNTTNGNLKILYKEEDVRKDKIITSIINLMDIYLKENDIDLEIVKYRVIEVGNNKGIIEFVDNSESIYDINQKETIINYLLNNNNNSTINDLRKRFIKSTAAYCVITYLLGIGDRHLENIMITNKGLLFHIDFTFILGYDPKLFSPMIRITPEMVEAIGGINSQHYIEFKKLCNKCFNCLRQYISIFSEMLLLLQYTYNSPIDYKQIENQIKKRFLPGEYNTEAEIQLTTTIYNSQYAYSYNLIDFFHYYTKK